MCVTVRTLCLLVSSVSVILSVARAVIHDMLHQSHKMVMMPVPHLDNFWCAHKSKIMCFASLKAGTRMHSDMHVIRSARDVEFQTASMPAIGLTSHNMF